MHNQSLRKHFYKNRKLRIEALTKMGNYFTIYQYKTEEPKNIEIFAPISLEV